MSVALKPVTLALQPLLASEQLLNGQLIGVGRRSGTSRDPPSMLAKNTNFT